jgi:hypothetical protein
VRTPSPARPRMKLGLLFVCFPMGFAALLGIALPAYPHGGGLDGYGCHNNRKTGGYHCHRGPFAGQSFASKEEMLKKLAGEEAPVNGKEKATR